MSGGAAFIDRYSQVWEFVEHDKSTIWLQQIPFVRLWDSGIMVTDSELSADSDATSRRVESGGLGQAGEVAGG